MRQIEQVLKKTEGIVACTGVGGLGILTNSFSPEFASFFCKLEPWEERNTPELHVTGVQQTLRRTLADIPGAVIFPFSPPTIPGFGAAGGFNFLLQDRSGTMTVAELGKQTQAFLEAARQRPELANLFTSFNPQVPQVGVDLDREKARTLGVPVNDVFAALSASMGGSLRERLQPLRPTLPGLRPGRAAVPAAARRYRAVLRQEHDQQPDGAALHARCE